MNVRTERIRVLVVDDEPGLRKAATVHLEDADDRLSVRTESTVTSALDRLADEDVDCIVSDYRMPGRDGLEFLAEVRARYPDLPFVLFTGWDSEAMAAEAEKAGADGYVRKGTGTTQYSVLADRVTTLAEESRADPSIGDHAKGTDDGARGTYMADGGEEIHPGRHARGDGNRNSPEDAVSLAVVEAVAEREDSDPGALSPQLCEVVDPDALNALFAPGPAGDRQVRSVTFTYKGYSVTVDGGGSVDVEK